MIFIAFFEVIMKKNNLSFLHAKRRSVFLHDVVSGVVIRCWIFHL